MILMFIINIKKNAKNKMHSKKFLQSLKVLNFHYNKIPNKSCYITIMYMMYMVQTNIHTCDKCKTSCLKFPKLVQEALLDKASRW